MIYLRQFHLSNNLLMHIREDTDLAKASAVAECQGEFRRLCINMLIKRITFKVIKRLYGIVVRQTTFSILAYYTLFLLYINDLPDDVICNIAIYTDDATLYSQCGQASDLWQQLESGSELESDQQDLMDWGRKWLVDFNAGRTLEKTSFV